MVLCFPGNSFFLSTEVDRARLLKIPWRQLRIATFLVASLPLAVHGHAITPFNGTDGLTADQAVTYKFLGTFPSWATTAVNNEFQLYFHNQTANNSLAPRLTYSATGTAKVTFSTALNPPCGGTAPQWLGCVTQKPGSSWTMYVRTLPAPGTAVDGWDWYERNGTCSQVDLCFYFKRMLLHEAGHSILGLNHYEQGEPNTVMSATIPWYGGDPLWSWTFIQGCDQARAQLTWDVRYTTSPIGDCTDHVSGAGPNGLNTVVTLSPSSTVLCVGQSVTLSGTLRITNTATYGPLKDNPLGLRIVSIKRNGGGLDDGDDHERRQLHEVRRERRHRVSHVPGILCRRGGRVAHWRQQHDNNRYVVQRLLDVTPPRLGRY